MRQHSDSTQVLWVDIKAILEFLIDNILIGFFFFFGRGDRVFQLSVGIPMGTNCAPLLHVSDMFLYYYETKFVQNVLHEKSPTMTFFLTFRYIDDVLSIKNNKLSYVDLYLSELEIKGSTLIYDKRDDFNFSTVKFRCLCINIPRETHGRKRQRTATNTTCSLRRNF